MYTEKMLDHFQHPRHVGELAAPAVTVEVMNPVCGDILRLSARWEGDAVAEARFKTRGCAASIAAGSALAHWITGRTAAELAALTTSVLETELGGLPNESRHAAVLGVDAVKALLKTRP